MSTYLRVLDHYAEAKECFNEDNIIYLALQGSQNYFMDTNSSDVDTKLIVTPSLHDIIMNHAPVSTTHIRANDEHIDFKDIRLMFQTFRKQNINFLEILFTKYYIINDKYKSEIEYLMKYREDIAHYNTYIAVKAMKGTVLEKYHAMEHRYPAKIDVIDKFGYDPKQLSHMLRVKEFIFRYLLGESYESCLIPEDREYLIDIKLGALTLEEARKMADETLAAVEEMTNIVTKESNFNHTNSNVDEVLDTVQEAIMRKSISSELGKN